jgi:hypothetical protein
MLYLTKAKNKLGCVGKGVVFLDRRNGQVVSGGGGFPCLLPWMLRGWVLLYWRGLGVGCDDKARSTWTNAWIDPSIWAAHFSTDIRKDNERFFKGVFQRWISR